MKELKKIIDNFIINKEIKTYIYAYITENLVYTDFFFVYNKKVYKKSQASILGAQSDPNTQLEVLDNLSKFFLNKKTCFIDLPICIKIVYDKNEEKIKITYDNKDNPENDFNNWFADFI